MKRLTIIYGAHNKFIKIKTKIPHCYVEPRGFCRGALGFRTEHFENLWSSVLMFFHSYLVFFMSELNVIKYTILCDFCCNWEFLITCNCYILLNMLASYILNYTRAYNLVWVKPLQSHCGHLSKVSVIVQTHTKVPKLIQSIGLYLKKECMVNGKFKHEKTVVV